MCARARDLGAFNCTIQVAEGPAGHSRERNINKEKIYRLRRKNPTIRQDIRGRRSWLRLGACVAQGTVAASIVAVNATALQWSIKMKQSVRHSADTNSHDIVYVKVKAFVARPALLLRALGFNYLAALSHIHLRASPNSCFEISEEPGVKLGFRLGSDWLLFWG